MNERIKELAEQAAFRQFTMPKTNGSSVLEGYNGMFTEHEAIEKFALLIVQDCVREIALIGVSNCENDDVSWTVDKSIENIRKHFGVEE